MFARGSGRGVLRWIVGEMPRRLLYALPIWLALLAAFWIYAQGREGGAVGLIERWLTELSGNPWALVGLMAVFAIRPLLLLPITVLTAFSGFLLGPVWGTLYALVAVLVSASIAYGLARFLGAGHVPEGRWWTLLRERSFEALVTARLMLLPGDAVNYAAGALRIDFGAFVLATALGGLPGLLVGVLAGASVEGVFAFEGVRLNAGYLLASAVLLVVSLTASRLLRRRFDV